MGYVKVNHIKFPFRYLFLNSLINGFAWNHPIQRNNQNTEQNTRSLNVFRSRAMMEMEPTHTYSDNPG